VPGHIGRDLGAGVMFWPERGEPERTVDFISTGTVEIEAGPHTKVRRETAGERRINVRQCASVLNVQL
jgi:hypothetical protein